MTQSSAAERFTAGERCLAQIIESPATLSPSSIERRMATHARIDVVWDADSDRNHH